MWWRLPARASAIMLLSLLFSLVGGMHWLGLWLARRPRGARQSMIGSYLTTFCRLLGATFVKVGQIVATRADLASEPLRARLQTLHDRVGPYPYAQVREALLHEFGRSPEQLLRELDPYPVASASVAQVHRGRLQDGRTVALKVLRPGIETLVRSDLALMRLLARVVAWIPTYRALSPRQTVDAFAEAIWQQLDLRVEAANNRSFAENFRDEQAVGVPELVEELCSRRVLCMAFVEGHKVLGNRWPPDQAAVIARTGFRMVLKMVFVDGLVHADLHPGNMFVVEGPRLVLVDLGLVVRLADRHRQGMIKLLAAWTGGDIAQLCDAVSQVAFFGQEPFDAVRLAEDMAALVQRYRDLTLAEIQIGELLADLIRMVRKQWPRIDPAFAMMALAIGVMEGVGRQLAPELRLADEALPYVMQVVC